MKAQTPEQLIEEVVERFRKEFVKIDSDGLSYIKIKDNVSMRIDGSVFPRIEQFLQDELSTIASKSAEDTKRLDFLDKCNRGLNNRYGTNYGWELILNHNVTRLMVEGHISWVDLHDSKAGNEKLKSCRDAIDKKMQALSQPKEQQ